MLEEWTSVAKPKLDQALVAEHIEKMVEVRGLEAKGTCWEQGSVKQCFSSALPWEPPQVPHLMASALVIPRRHRAQHISCIMGW